MGLAALAVEELGREYGLLVLREACNGLSFRGEDALLRKALEADKQASS